MNAFTFGALFIAILSGFLLGMARLYQQPPDSLASRKLSCSFMPEMCTFSSQKPESASPRAIAGRWKQVPSNPNWFLDKPGIQFKRWQYLSMSSDDWFVGAAFVKFSYVSDVFLYAVRKDRPEEMFEYTARLPLGLGVVTTKLSTSGCTKWGTPEMNLSNSSTYSWMELCARENGAGYHFRASVQANKFHLDEKSHVQQKLIGNHLIQIDATLYRNEDMFLLYPIYGDRERLMYVHKLAGMPINKQSFIQVGNDKSFFNNGAGGLDWTKGRAHYRTFWRWASLNVGKAWVQRGKSNKATQEALGINFSQDVYDVLNDEKKASDGENNFTFSTENAVWLQGNVYFMESAIEIHVPENPLVDTWKIKSRHSTTREEVDLTFQPLGAREDHANFGILLSDFVQPFGYFKGTIRLNTDITVNIDHPAFGVVEDHKAYW